MISEILAAAKRLWPEIDTDRVHFIRTERAHVEFLERDAGWHPERYYPYTEQLPIIRMTPLMTTEGYALAWSPEENVVVWKETLCRQVDP